MGRISKIAALLLTIVIAMSYLTLQNANAQTIPKPSVPEFSLKYIDLSYDVPPTYEVDQFTGKTVVKTQGYHVDNQSIEFTFRNQQFTPYNDSNGNSIKLYYNFRFKGNYGDTWTYYPENPNGHSVIHYSGGIIDDTKFHPPFYPASNADYTVISLSLTLLGPPVGGQAIPKGVTVDFQTQTMIGYFQRDEYGYFILTGQSSDWSSTKMVTIGETSTSPTIFPTPTPTVPEFTVIAILPLLLATVPFVVVKLFRKRK